MLKKKISHFIGDSKGVILIFTAVTMIPTSAVVYAGLDAARGYAVKHHFAQAMNLGLISSRDYLISKGVGYKGPSPKTLVTMNFAPGSTTNIKVKSSLSNLGQLTLTGSASLKTRFNLNLLTPYYTTYGGKTNLSKPKNNQLSIKVTSVGQIDHNPIEIAFAVDVLDFKAWNGQIVNLGQFLMSTDVIYKKLEEIQNLSNNLRISVIPYGATVNVASSLNSKFMASSGNKCVNEPNTWTAQESLKAFSPYRNYFFDQFGDGVAKGWENHGCPLHITPLTTDLNAIRMGAPLGYSGAGYSLNPVSYVNGITQVSQSKPLHHVGLNWAWRSIATDWGKEGAWPNSSKPSSDPRAQKAIILLTGNHPGIQSSIRDYMDWWDSGDTFYIDLGLFSIPLFNYLSLTNIDHYSAYGYRYDDGMDPLDLAAYVAIIGWSDYYDTDKSVLTPTNILDQVDNLVSSASKVMKSGQKVQLYSFGVGHEIPWIDSSLEQAFINDLIYRLISQCNSNTNLSFQGGDTNNWGCLSGADFTALRDRVASAVVTALEDLKVKSSYVKLV